LLGCGYFGGGGYCAFDSPRAIPPSPVPAAPSDKEENDARDETCHSNYDPDKDGERNLTDQWDTNDILGWEVGEVNKNEKKKKKKYSYTFYKRDNY
jgi:hypothetical protein